MRWTRAFLYPNGLWARPVTTGLVYCRQLTQGLDGLFLLQTGSKQAPSQSHLKIQNVQGAFVTRARFAVGIIPPDDREVTTAGSIIPADVGQSIRYTTWNHRYSFLEAEAIQPQGFSSRLFCRLHFFPASQCAHHPTDESRSSIRPDPDSLH